MDTRPPLREPPSPTPRDCSLTTVVVFTLTLAAVPAALWAVDHPALSAAVLTGFTATLALVATRRRLGEA